MGDLTGIIVLDAALHYWVTDDKVFVIKCSRANNKSNLLAKAYQIKTEYSRCFSLVIIKIED